MPKRSYGQDDCLPPKVLQINNQECPVLFHKVTIPAEIGDDEAYPPKPGLYRNTLLVYEANHHVWMYSSDGIPTFISDGGQGVDDYNELINKPSIDGHELVGDSSLEDIGVTDAIEDALEDYTPTSEFAEVAFTGDYDDLIGTPTIPVVNDATLTVTRNGASAGTFTANSADNTTIDIPVPTATSDLTNDSGFITNTVDSLVNYYTKTETDSAIDTETTNREDADQGLQEQIDALASASDVVDVVGTYADLQNYDTSHLNNNDIIKVLTDETHNDAISYYRWNTATSTFSYVGSQGPFYTKSESDATFVPQARTVNNKALSSDITLTASDVGALPDSTVIPTVNNATLTIQKEGSSIGTFTANSATNTTVNVVETDPTVPSWAKQPTKPTYSYSEITNKPTIPTKTSDLTNDGEDGTSTYVEAADLATVATSGSYADLTNKPTIPAAQVNSDWNANSGVAQILNKPTLAAVATSGSYTDLSNTPAIPTKTSDLINDGSDGAAQYLETDETAYKTASIPFGVCDSTSTSTVFTATVPGITELRDGVCMWLENGVVTSAANFTININGLGAKPVYHNMAAATRETTLFNVNYTFLFVYDSTRVEGGCWMLYRGYNSNDNTIGYQVRTNSQSLPMSSITYRYRLLFTSADGTHYVPANNSTSTNATASRTVNQEKINPFGRIFYYGTTASVAANARPATTALWEQYAISLGYSFNRTGAALTLTSWKPVYVKAAPQADGSAIIDSTTPYVQDLPTTEDGFIYIFLGVAYSATNIELQLDHPIYWYKDGMIRPYTNAAAGISSVAWGDITGTLSSQTDLNTALGAKANTADLAAVATSGSYNDLSDKPTIGNAALTIQKNGTNVATFTANASSNVTANIEVPTYTAGSGIDITNNVISTTANTFASYSNCTLYITNTAQNADTEDF